MITTLPVDIRAAAPIISTRRPRPRWIFYRTLGEVVVEACCCDTDDEAAILKREFSGRPGATRGWKDQKDERTN